MQQPLPGFNPYNRPIKANPTAIRQCPKGYYFDPYLNNRMGGCQLAFFSMSSHPDCRYYTSYNPVSYMQFIPNPTLGVCVNPKMDNLGYVMGDTPGSPCSFIAPPNYPGGRPRPMLGYYGRDGQCYPMQKPTFISPNTQPVRPRTPGTNSPCRRADGRPGLFRQGRCA